MRLFAKSDAWTPQALDAFVDVANASERGRLSLPQVGTALVSWPQTYTGVAAGAPMLLKRAAASPWGKTSPMPESQWTSMSTSPTRPSVETASATQVDEAIVMVSRKPRPTVVQETLERPQAGLEAYGIKNLSSFRTDWFRGRRVGDCGVDPRRERFGRCTAAAWIGRQRFPIASGGGTHGPQGGRFLEDIIPEKAYELNALWNSIELAGMGLGSEFLIQVSMAALPLLEAKHLVALTSPVTRRWREKHGWKLRSDLGTRGISCIPRNPCEPPWNTLFTRLRNERRPQCSGPHVFDS